MNISYCGFLNVPLWSTATEILMPLKTILGCSYRFRYLDSVGYRTMNGQLTHPMNTKIIEEFHTQVLSKFSIFNLLVLW